jgi:Ohr subfamily peroxiredoxin
MATLFRSAPRLALRANPTARFLNTATAPSLYQTTVSVTGARNGHIKGEFLDMQLAMPKTLGGSGKGSNPEELFAAGYGSCYQSAMNLTAQMMGLKMPKKVEDCIVETTVHLVGDLKAADMGIRVDMKVKVRGMEKNQVEELVKKTEEVCPYSRATKGNVQTNIEVIIL